VQRKTVKPVANIARVNPRGDLGRTKVLVVRRSPRPQRSIGNSGKPRKLKRRQRSEGRPGQTNKERGNRGGGNFLHSAAPSQDKKKTSAPAKRAGQKVIAGADSPAHVKKQVAG